MPDLVIFVGLQASGKTTFFLRHFQATHEHVSKDLFPNARNRDRRQAREIDAALAAFKSVVVDNTNATRESRAAPIEAARRYGARIVGYVFESSLEACIARNEKRVGKTRVPLVAIYTTAKKLEPPAPEEGFDELHHVRIVEGAFVVLPWFP